MESLDQIGSSNGKHFVPDLPRLLSYDLSNGEAAEVIEHLRGCGSCREELVEAVAEGYPSEAILPRWFTAPPASVPSSGRIRRPSPRTLRNRRKWLTALIVLVLIALPEFLRYFVGPLLGLGH
ncbi:zf-HC2 domain-containing protein [Actinoallomurus rhizosphaericola]|uniref:zf-HC2 domain-containing protein n=1 Tax=Actinoallomurus rhizosphaericola TaxID=2952536 RepID=UPI0038732DCA